MPERLVKVASRSATVGQMSMWGTLHLSLVGGKLGGWLCDSWTVAGASASEVLLPRLHWLGKDDDKFHLAMLDIPVTGVASINVGPIDTEIEPRREAFMRSTLQQWENEYLASESVQIT
jgi:hypothetical protein